LPLNEGFKAKERRREERGRDAWSHIYTRGPSRGALLEAGSRRARGLVM
jgi:hypothetical protein